MTEPGLDLLAFSPHPDDVEMCCGGLLIASAERGHRVGVVDLTRGELSTNGTVAQRAEEAAAAAEVLGLCHRENLGLPDGGLAPWSEDPAQLTRVVEAIRRLRPEVVLLPWHEARHPDHRATHHLVTRAAFFAYVQRFETTPAHPRFRPRRLLHYQMRHRFRPSFVVDTSAVAARKLEAIRCYQSQFGAPGSSEGSSVPTILNTPRALEAIELRDRYYGAMLGVSHGEPYGCEQTLAVADPVAFFREAPPGPPEFFEGSGALP